MGSVAISVGSAATTSPTPTPTTMVWTRRRLLLSASIFCWTYFCLVYIDILFDAKLTASFYLMMSLPTLLMAWMNTHAMIEASSPTNPTTTIDSDCLTYITIKAASSDVAQLVIALLPFLFFLHVHESLMTSLYLVCPLSYMSIVGFVLIGVMDLTRTRYWLLLCFLAAAVCTPFTGFYPHHARLLKLKLVTAVLAVVIAALCGLAYYDHRSCEACLIEPKPSPSTA